MLPLLGGALEGRSGGAPGGRSGGVPGGRSGGAPGGRSGGVPGGRSGGAPGGRSGGAPGGRSGGAPGGRSGGIPGGRSGGDLDGGGDGGNVSSPAFITYFFGGFLSKLSLLPCLEGNLTFLRGLSFVTWVSFFSPSGSTCLRLGGGAGAGETSAGESEGQGGVSTVAATGLYIRLEELSFFWIASNLSRPVSASMSSRAASSSELLGSGGGVAADILRLHVNKLEQINALEMIT